MAVEFRLTKTVSNTVTPSDLNINHAGFSGLLYVNSGSQYIKDISVVRKYIKILLFDPTFVQFY